MPNGEMPGPVDIEPGAWIQIEEERLALEKYIADLSAELARATDATARAEIANRLRIAQMDYDQKQRETELALATSPIDFVAYETYKREAQQASLEGRPRPSPTDVVGGGTFRTATGAARERDLMERAMAEKRAGHPAAQKWTPSGPYPSRDMPNVAQGIQAAEADLVRRGERGRQAWGPKVTGIGPPPPGFTLPTNKEEFGWPVFGPSEYYTEMGALRPSEAWSPSGPVGVVHSDAEINAMLAEMTGVEQGGMQGVLGTAVPRSQQFSRSGFADMSEDERAVLASFLRAGVGEMGSREKVSIDPTEYYREMEEGFVPAMRDIGPTGYKF